MAASGACGELRSEVVHSALCSRDSFTGLFLSRFRTVVPENPWHCRSVLGGLTLPPLLLVYIRGISAATASV